MTPEQLGDARHERCRYGIFAREAYSMGLDGSAPVPFAMPLCGKPLPEGLPPVVSRLWGGQIELARDCAVCPAFDPTLPPLAAPPDDKQVGTAAQQT